MLKKRQNSMKKWYFLPLSRHERQVMGPKEDNLEKKNRTLGSDKPPYFDWLSESTQPLSNYDLESLSRT